MLIYSHRRVHASPLVAYEVINMPPPVQARRRGLVGFPNSHMGWAAATPTEAALTEAAFERQFELMRRSVTVTVTVRADAQVGMPVVPRLRISRGLPTEWSGGHTG